METQFKAILDSVQKGSANHQKNLRVLENLYKKSDSEFFSRIFVQYVLRSFLGDATIKNPYVEKVLDFGAKFVYNLTKQEINETDISEEDSPSNPFLSYIIQEIVKYHDLVYIQARYYSCRFITLILQHLGNDTHLDNDLCDLIQNAMLERIQDFKPSIRLQAVMALVRLQEPYNPDCLIVKAYVNRFCDSSALVRREVVRRIAPNSVTIPKIKDRIRDIDPNVRISAFVRCADIGPKLFKIVDRQQILLCGFNDVNKKVKQTFTENLLPKWLTVYQGNFLSFLGALKLDAEESDIISTEELSKKVMEVFFRTMPIKDIISALPLDNDKLVPLNNVSSEVVTYWSILVGYLRKSEETEEFLDNIIPELTPFCHYIESLVKAQTSKNMEEWEYLDYQYILYNLIGMAEEYDLTDEVGRRTFQALVTWILQNNRLQYRLLCKVVSIAEKLSSNNIDSFTSEICQIISDIREPLVVKQPSNEENREKAFQIARIEVKLNVLEGDMEEALDSQDFQRATILKNEIAECRKQLENMDRCSQSEKVRVSRDDPDTLCWCLDMLSALLQLSEVKSITPALMTCKNEFLMPLLTSNSSEINWRVLKCLSLYCLLDREIAEENAKILCIPIATYRAIPNYNKSALTVSVSAISDLIRIYGPTLFQMDEDDRDTNVTTNTTRRRLYQDQDMDDFDRMNNRLTLEFMIEIVLDMLDDENEEIREIAVTAIMKLILDGFQANPMLISRLILKWYNPLTEKSGDRLQQRLGLLIETYSKTVQEAKQVIEKAVIPILTSIASAPKSSPLSDIDIDNLIRLLAAITNSDGVNDIVSVHNNLAHSICSKIVSKPNDDAVPFLAKMLVNLEIPSENPAPVKELIAQAELLLQEEYNLDKAPKRNVMKFIEKLKSHNFNEVDNSNLVENQTGDKNEERRLETILEADDAENVNTVEDIRENEEIQPKKRKKNNNGNNGIIRNQDDEKENTNRRVTRSSIDKSNQSGYDIQPIAESTRNNTNNNSIMNKCTVEKTNEALKNMCINELQVKRKKCRGRRKLINTGYVSDSRISPTGVSEISQVEKLRNGTSRITQNANCVDPTTDTSSDLSLHTIIENSQNTSTLEDDMTIQTPSTSSSSSGRKQIVISETSSDSESNMVSLRRSGRKIKKRNYDHHV